MSNQSIHRTYVRWRWFTCWIMNDKIGESMLCLLVPASVHNVTSHRKKFQGT